jgi:hypothetical protein
MQILAFFRGDPFSPLLLDDRLYQLCHPLLSLYIIARIYMKRDFSAHQCKGPKGEMLLLRVVTLRDL